MKMYFASANRNTPNTTVKKSSLRFLLTIMTLSLLSSPVMAQFAGGNTGGLDQTVSIFETLREYAFLIIPVICLISGGAAGLFYSLDVIRKETLYSWIGGTLFAGLISAGIVKLVF